MVYVKGLNSESGLGFLVIFCISFGVEIDEFRALVA
jgi:hypothetical protein